MPPLWQYFSRLLVSFRASHDRVALDGDEAQEFKRRLELVPGGQEVAPDIQRGIDGHSIVLVPDNRKSDALSVLDAWLAEGQTLSSEVRDLREAFFRDLQ